MKSQSPCCQMTEPEGEMASGVLGPVCPDTSSKATLWMKALHEGALATLFIVRKTPQDPHTPRAASRESSLLFLLERGHGIALQAMQDQALGQASE